MGGDVIAASHPVTSRGFQTRRVSVYINVLRTGISNQGLWTGGL